MSYVGEDQEVEQRTDKVWLLLKLDCSGRCAKRRLEEGQGRSGPRRPVKEAPISNLGRR